MANADNKPTKLDVRAEFGVHTLSAAGKQRAIGIARAFDGLLDRLEELCGTDGRQMALVRTDLERACFHAKKAMASRDENQEPAPVVED